MIYHSEFEKTIALSMRRSRNLQVHLPFGPRCHRKTDLCSLQLKETVAVSTAHRGDFCPLQVSAAVSVPFWQKFLQKFGKKCAACGISVSKWFERKISLCSLGLTAGATSGALLSAYNPKLREICAVSEFVFNCHSKVQADSKFPKETLGKWIGTEGRFLGF